MATCSLHHVEIATKTGEKVLKLFTDMFSFTLIATRETKNCAQWVLEAGSFLVLITEIKELDDLDFSKPQQRCADCISDSHVTAKSTYSPKSVDTSLEYLTSCIRPSIDIDSVYNIALRVKNVSSCFDRATKFGAEIIATPKLVKNEHGFIEYAVIKSCVGNIIHTLICDENYSGIFLPGFRQPSVPESESASNTQDNILQNFDHVTYAVPMGSSKRIINWYEECFGMKRFIINSDENETEGFLVQGDNVGLRLHAIEYWKCAESGLCFEKDSDHVNSLKIVLAEALPGQGINQVNIFLEDHGGAGVQHIGLHTGDIVNTMAMLRNNGVSFIEPPPTYYTQLGKLDDIETVGESVQILQKYGILLDSESTSENTATDQRYLMQAFTKPLFGKNTFFLEIIQRHGATGFGAGNITALWRAVQVFMAGKNNDAL